jgi:hypothetical protein
MGSTTANFALGDVVCIDGRRESLGKVLDMHTRHDRLEYLVEHPASARPFGEPPAHGDSEWVPAERLELVRHPEPA